MTTTSEEIIKTIQAALARARAHRRKDTNVSIYPHIPTNVRIFFSFLFFCSAAHARTQIGESATVVSSNYGSKVEPALFFELSGILLQAVTVSAALSPGDPRSISLD